MALATKAFLLCFLIQIISIYGTPEHFLVETEDGSGGDYQGCTKWTNWSRCSTSCKGGKAYRSCATDATNKETKDCNENVDCFSEGTAGCTKWTNWSRCSTSCKGGKAHRSCATDSTATVRLVGCESGEVGGLDTLEKMVNEDKEEGKKPVMVIANVHSVMFHKESVCLLREFCNKSQIWLHLEGHALSALTLLPSNDEKSLVQRSDSMTLTFGSWVGIPSVPFITLYRNDCSTAQTAGLGVVTPAVRLSRLPLWCVLRSLGSDQVRARVKGVHRLLEVVSGKLSGMSCIRLLSQTGDRTQVLVDQLESGQVEEELILNTVSPALAFQYVSDTPPGLSSRVPPYTDNLNSWLGQILQRDAPHVPIEIVDVETTGYVLERTDSEDVARVGLQVDEVDTFLQVLQEKCDILDATVAQRAKFMELIELDPSVQHVDIAHWAGLGGVRYIPSEFLDEETGKVVELGEEELRVVNQRNMELVATLRNTDSTFSLGEGPPPDSWMCVRFGMVTMETVVEELLTLVINCGKDIDKAVN